MTSVNVHTGQDDGGDRLVIKKQQNPVPFDPTRIKTDPFNARNDRFYQPLKGPQRGYKIKAPDILSDHFRILSLPGGGIQGVVALETLARIEERTGKSICDLFDMIAGTSTGGIIALALAKNKHTGKPTMTARELQKIYIDEGKNIFGTSLIGKIERGFGFLQPMYNSDILAKKLSVHFNDLRLSDLETPVIVIATQEKTGEHYYFRSHNTTSEDFKLIDAALATSAAPLYFKAHRVTGKDGEKYHFIDGGLLRNDPIDIANKEGEKFFNGKPTMLVSVENGYSKKLSTQLSAVLSAVFEMNQRISGCQFKEGLIAKIPSFLNATFKGQSKIDREHLDPATTFSINPKVDQKITGKKKAKTSLDAASPDNIQNLLDRTRLSLDEMEKDPDSYLSRLFQTLLEKDDAPDGNNSPSATVYTLPERNPHLRLDAA